MPCLDCGRPTGGAVRCEPHSKAKERARPKRAAMGYTASWNAFSRKRREEQPWCSWCGATEDLTTDHATYGLVLCRSCNTAKQHSDKAARLK